MASTDNVFIFGAGVSFDAGIPLLRPFLDKMWEYCQRGRVGEKAISEADLVILKHANRIANDLERYNARASFDNTNIEDILSLLSFEALTGPQYEEKFNTMVAAIARTIELSCTLHSNNRVLTTPPDKNTQYHVFWDRILGPRLVGSPPALITFNYDLVFERALWEYLHLRDDGILLDVGSCSLDYIFCKSRFALRTVRQEYRFGSPPNSKIVNGRRPEYTGDPTQVSLPYFKLHGSLNWEENGISAPPTDCADKPIILPPVFNKMTTGVVNGVWKCALDVLRKAKHIIIVGYSLPRTDIYMQYFLKAAVGPNSDLKRIFVFDPVLFRGGPEAEEMKVRYEECFSPQFTGRISFKPNPTRSLVDILHGTFHHFVYTLGECPESILFLP